MFSQLFISLCHSLPADYFTLHWALYMQDWSLTWDAVYNMYSNSMVDFSVTLPGVSLVPTQFKEFIYVVITAHMLWITVQTRHLVNMLEYSFKRFEIQE